MTSRATGTGIMVKWALTSKDTKLSSGATFCSFRDSASPQLSLTNENFLLQYRLKLKLWIYIAPFKMGYALPKALYM